MTARLSNPAASANPRRQWYGTQIWKNIRRAQLRREPLCAICKAEGRITPATVADHHPGHDGNYTAFIRGPLRSLCASCHDALQGFVHKPYSDVIGDDGMPTDPAHPFNKPRPGA